MPDLLLLHSGENLIAFLACRSAGFEAPADRTRRHGGQRRLSPGEDLGGLLARTFSDGALVIPGR